MLVIGRWTASNSQHWSCFVLLGDQDQQDGDGGKRQETDEHPEEVMSSHGRLLSNNNSLRPTAAEVSGSNGLEAV